MADPAKAALYLEATYWLGFVVRHGEEVADL